MMANAKVRPVPRHDPVGDDESPGSSVRSRAAAAGSRAAAASSFVYRTDLPGHDRWGSGGGFDPASWDSDCRPAVAFINEATGFGCTTYDGHDPIKGRAIDIWPSSRANHTRLANWLKDNIGHLGVQYVVASAQIYNIARASEGVRLMEDRGSPTQNHQDHVHVSFVERPPISTNFGAVTRWDDRPPVIPPTTPPPSEDSMSLTVIDFKHKAKTAGRYRFVRLVPDAANKRFSLIVHNGATIVGHPANGFGVAVVQEKLAKPVSGIEPEPDGLHFIVTADDGGTFRYTFGK